MLKGYCTTVIELKEFDNPLVITDYVKNSGIDATFEADVIFVGGDVDLEDVQKIYDLASFISRTVKFHDHDIITIEVKSEDDSPILNYDIIVKERQVYIKRAELIQ